MPSKSLAQAKLMRAVSHNPAFAKKVGVPQAVGQELEAVDEARADDPEKRKAVAKAMMGR